jgi:hypothetical protein
LAGRGGKGGKQGGKQGGRLVLVLGGKGDGEMVGWWRKRLKN